MEITAKAHRSLLMLMLVSGSSCTDTNAAPMMLEAGLHAGCPQEPVSLVSLVFPRLDETKSVQATDLRTGSPIQFDFVELENAMVVTLKLHRNLESNPHLVFNGVKSFKASVTPEQSLLLFDGLSFSEHIVFLRDYGVERILELGKELNIRPQDVVRLWLKDRFVMGARVTFTNPGTSDSLKLLVEGCSIAATMNGAELETANNNLQLGGYESTTLVASPLPDAGTSYLSVVAR